MIETLGFSKINIFTIANTNNPFKICLLTEILNNYEQHLLQNDFYLENNLNQMLALFYIHFQQEHVLFDLISLLTLLSLASKSVFVTKFAAANLAAKFSAVKLLNSGVVIYLS